jgi:acyl-CoA synthetase (AMP-forming)/AMP-acid ligase II
MIKSGGENIHTSEVEAALLDLSGVVEAAVVAVPHERYGECVGALLFKDHGHLSRDGIADHSHGNVAGTCSGRLARGHEQDGSLSYHALANNELQMVQNDLVENGLSAFKVPRVVIVTKQAIPRSAMGKMDKRRVAEILEEVINAKQMRSRM